MINRQILEDVLLEAFKSNKYEMVASCLAKGAEGTKLEKGETILQIAMSNQDAKMIALLLPKVDLSVTNDEGKTPIQWAADQNAWNYVMMIAKARRQGKKKYNYGSALLSAVYCNQYKVAKVLLEADANTGGTGGFQIARTKNLALHEAVKRNNAALVALLMKFESDPNKVNKKGETPILLATRKKYWDCVEAFINPEKYLIKNPADIQLILFYLLSANRARLNLPYDAFKLILYYAFTNLGPSLLDPDAAIKKFVTLRPQRLYVCNTTLFLKDFHSPTETIRRAFESKHPDTKKLVKSLEKITADKEPIDDKADKLRDEIYTFSARQENLPSGTLKLLHKHQLIFRGEPIAAPAEAKENAATKLKLK